MPEGETGGAAVLTSIWQARSRARERGEDIAHKDHQKRLKTGMPLQAVTIGIPDPLSIYINCFLDAELLKYAI